MRARPGIRCAIWGLRGPRGSCPGNMARGQSGGAAEKHSARPAKRGRRAAQILRGGGEAGPQSRRVVARMFSACGHFRNFVTF
jgi:hypothetical protein